MTYGAFLLTSTSEPSSAAPASAKIPPDANSPFPGALTRVIQVNYCKYPPCKNYGVPPSLPKGVHRAKDPSADRLPGTEYAIAARGAKLPTLVCALCNEHPPMKSNAGIAEELERIAGYLKPEVSLSCPVEGCANHGVPTTAGTAYYYAYGKSDEGSQRYKCRGCGKTFSVPARATLRQRLPQVTRQIFKLLMNKMPLLRICEVAGISPWTLYNRISFIHKRCLAFAAVHERKLMNMALARSVYVAVDRQNYVVNWTNRKDKRNIMLTAVGSADLTSGYVFGMHLNFDGRLDTQAVELDAKACGDPEAQLPFRRYARLWLELEYAKAVTESESRAAKKAKVPSATLGDKVAKAYADAEGRDDVESPEMVTAEESFPKRGMQVHSEYTLYAHFFYLHELLRGAQKVRFFLDQESGIRAACLAAFQQEVKGKTCDAFYVQIAKDLMVSEKRKAIAESRSAFKEMQDANPRLKPREVEILMMKVEMARAAKIGKWNDRWLTHPFPNSSEPQKTVCYLTEYKDDKRKLDEDHLARLYLRASLHAIDRFFNQVRRRLSFLERPIATSSKVGRTWHGYSAYQPENIEKVLAVFRVYYNYCLKGKDGKTPAMRLGLVTKVATIGEILS